MPEKPTVKGFNDYHPADMVAGGRIFLGLKKLPVCGYFEVS